jgi:hypothetical protein
LSITFIKLKSVFQNFIYLQYLGIHISSIDLGEH